MSFVKLLKPKTGLLSCKSFSKVAAKITELKQNAKMSRSCRSAAKQPCSRTGTSKNTKY